MCLAKLTEVNFSGDKYYKLKNQPKKKIGYKVYYKRANFSGVSVYETHGRDILIDNKWKHASRGIINVYSSFYGRFAYPHGFHIVLSLKDAKTIMQVKKYNSRYKIVKIEFDDIIATGVETQFGGEINCVIARKMRIIKEY